MSNERSCEMIPDALAKPELCWSSSYAKAPLWSAWLGPNILRGAYGRPWPASPITFPQEGNIELADIGLSRFVHFNYIFEFVSEPPQVRARPGKMPLQSVMNLHINIPRLPITSTSAYLSRTQVHHWWNNLWSARDWRRSYGIKLLY